MGADLKDKIERSRRVIRLGLKGTKADDIAIAWTGGKDSTVLLHLVKTMFGNVPFPVFFNDSTMEFQEIYGFIRKISKLWCIRLITVKHSEADLKLFIKLNSTDKLEFTRIMKINAINQALAVYKWKGIMSGIRRDEHKARSKETYISKRPNHIRIHPLLHFTEKDIWSYIKQENVPYVSLYDKGYRSLGEAPFTSKSVKGMGERSGREPAKEKLMEITRKLGYW